ncbi:MAG: polysaccharide biosynthesis protein [Cellulosilyticum sp.]|nr:polysaccharide biosynthesis protein [Cellulosilyticum sp.]
MKTTDNKQSLMKGAMILSIGVLASRIIGMLYRIPIRNILGDEGQSIYGVAYGIYVVILTLTAMAIPGALSKLIAERRAAGAYKEAQRVFHLAMLYSIGFALVMAAGLWLGADFISDNFFQSQDVALPIRALAPTVVIATSLGVFRGYFQGRGDMTPTASSQVIEQIVNVIFSVILAAYFMNITAGNLVWGATGSALGTGAGAIAGFVVLIFLFFKKRPQAREELVHSTEYDYQSSFTILKQILSMMIPVIVSASIFSIMTSIDQSMISNILPQNIEYLRNHQMLNMVPVLDAEIYSTQSIVSQLSGQLSFQYMTFMNIPVSLILQLGLASVPAIAAGMAAGAINDVKQKTKMIFKVGMLIAAPSAIGFLVFAHPILTLVVGDSSGAELLSSGAIGILAIAIAQLSAGILQGMTKQNIPTINALIACAIKVGINLVALRFPTLNIYGFVHSTTICYVIYAILNMYYLQKYLKMKMSWNDILIRPTVCAAVMGIVSFAVYLGLLWIGLSVKLAIVLVMPLAAVIYFAVGVGSRTITKGDLASIPGGRKLIKLLKLS